MIERHMPEEDEEEDEEDYPILTRKWNPSAPPRPRSVNPRLSASRASGSRSAVLRKASRDRSALRAKPKDWTPRPPRPGTPLGAYAYCDTALCTELGYTS
eukprot:2528666-Rhodomonas_salina.1